jgi:hypothetical protein
MLIYSLFLTHSPGVGFATEPITEPCSEEYTNGRFQVRRPRLPKLQLHLDPRMITHAPCDPRRSENVAQGIVVRRFSFLKKSLFVDDVLFARDIPK